MHNHKAEIDRILSQILDDIPGWTVEPVAEQGYYGMRVYSQGIAHPGEGLGDGFINLLSIADALYDAPPNTVIAIDEPELSLHPLYQRRLAKVLAEHATNRQIVYATYSPYFID